MDNENSTKELDLIDIIKIFWRWFIRFIWKPFVFCLRFIIRKWWVGLCAIFAGIGISFFISSQFPVYTGTVIFRNNVCNSTDFINNVKFMSYSSPEYKAEVLGIDVTEAVNIYAIYGHHLCYSDSLREGYIVDMSDFLIAKGTVCLQNMFAVEILATDKDVFSSVQEGLQRYFNSSEYFINKNKERIAALKSCKTKVDVEISKLDSIRNNMSGTVAVSTTSMVNGQPVSTLLDPTVISSEIVKLNETSVKCRNSLEYAADIVTVVSPVKHNAQPDNFYMYTWTKYVLCSLFVCYALALLVVYRKQVMSFIKG